MMKTVTVTFLSLLFFAAVVSAQNSAELSSSRMNRFDERIISFNSEITIDKDGSMIVTERIKAHAEGLQIKRGIYRDLPTRYKDAYGNNVIISFDVLEVYRDDKPESYHTENLSNGIRVYFGRSDFYLPRGDYTYTIKYKTDRQIGYFDNFDELYWNVTGNGWDFEIEKASCTINLPAGVSREELNLLAYTGYQGDRGNDYKYEVLSTDKVLFEMIRSLRPTEGLTIVVQFPKGLVNEPTDAEKLKYFAVDNSSIIIGILGLALLTIYYLLIWWRVGRDPKKGLIIPLYEPPDKLSPAAVRFISEMGYDNKTFTVTIIGLAVKGYLKIEEDGKDYSIVRTANNTKPLTADERVVYEKLSFTNSNGKMVLELKQKNHSVLQNAIKSLKNSLKNSFEKNYFFTNKKYFIIGLVITIVIVILSSAEGNEEQTFMTIWISGWSIGVAAILFTVFRTWKGVLARGRGKIAALGSAIFISLFAIPFVIGEIVGLYFFAQMGSPFMIVVIGFLVLCNVIFYHLLKAPTLLGRKLMDKIDGFRMYLSVAEKDSIEAMKEPAKTSELFETFLPYAIALKVENEWSNKFSDALEIAQQKDSYSPSWYHGTSWSALGASGFASSLAGSFSSSISSSSTAPGSSSGGSGGSSGGGGGGGGGGGW